MSHFPSDNPRSWLDEALRDVPLPPDLLARLRQLGIDNDGELGESLRRVPVPQALTARLKQIPDDIELDRHVREVPVSAGLLAALKEIPQVGPAVPTGVAVASVSGEQRPTPTPSATPTPAGRSSPMAERATWWVVAASLLAVVTLAVLGYVADVGPISAGGPGGSPVADGRWTVLEDGRTPPELPSQGSVATGRVPRGTIPPVAEAPDALARRLDHLPSEVVAQEASVLDGTGGLSVDPLLDAPLAAMEQLAMPDSLGGPRRMGLLAPGGASRIVPPTAQGFDWTSLLRDGAFPFVSPADHPQLTTLSLPLVSGSAGDGVLRDLVAREEPVAPQDVRTEEFLAAVDYNYPVPTDRAVALYASGGPSPWDPIERKFLLLGVQARGSAPHDRSPVDVTFVIDASLSGPGLDALAACREALGRSLAALTAEDRVSIVLAAGRPIWLAQGAVGASGEELAGALAQLGRVQPQPIVDVVPALEAAMRQPRDGDRSRRKLVVCVTSDLAYVGRSDAERLAGLAATGASQGLRLDVVRLAPVGRRDDVSGRLAQAGGGEVHAASGARELWGVLYPLLTEQSPVVAREVALTLQFDPKTVETYRVLGHEMHAIGPARGSTAGKVNLLLRDTCVVMLEVKLRHSVAGDVGTARVEWRDVQTGELESIDQRIGAAQFAMSLGEATLPMQRATLVAMTAEILRRAPAVPADATLQDVVHHADVVDSRLWDEAWLVDLVEAIAASKLTHGASRIRGAPRLFGF